jgi:hypothetical protein
MRMQHTRAALRPGAAGILLEAQLHSNSNTNLSGFRLKVVKCAVVPCLQK